MFALLNRDATVELETVWSGQIEAAAIKAAQTRPAVSTDLPAHTTLAMVRTRVLAHLRDRPGSSTQAMVDRLHVSRRLLGDALYTLERAGAVERCVAVRGSTRTPTVWKLTVRQ